MSDEQSREQVLSCLEEVKLDLEELKQHSSAVVVGQAVEIINSLVLRLYAADERLALTVNRLLDQENKTHNERQARILAESSLDTAEQERDEAREAQRGNYAAAELLRSERDAALLRLSRGLEAWHRYLDVRCSVVGIARVAAERELEAILGDSLPAGGSANTGPVAGRVITARPTSDPSAGVDGAVRESPQQSERIVEKLNP